jgi:hypothetical protein
MINFSLKQFYSLIFLLTCFFFKGFAQSHTAINIKGIIKNTNNEAIDGATLFLKDGHSGQVVKQGVEQ